jgi:ParB family transcriptional regulator, chromosome partitioning protein
MSTKVTAKPMSPAPVAHKATLTDRASGVNLSPEKLLGRVAKPDPLQGVEPFHTPHTPKTAIGLHASSIFHDQKLTDENEQMKLRLTEFDGANAERILDPSKVFHSKWVNRLPQSFGDTKFKKLLAEIDAAGGNVQAIKVRPIKDRPGEYEVVFGHRRHHACLTLGLPVRAVIEDMDDHQLYRQMTKENIGQEPPRPYEAGLSYARAIAGPDPLFTSARKLAESLQVDHSLLSKALILAGLPTDVLNAFTSPLDLQYRWANPLSQAIQNAPDMVLECARAIQQESPRPNSSIAFKRLAACGTVPHEVAKPKEVTIKGKGGQSGFVRMGADGNGIEISLKNIKPERFREVRAAIEALLA